MYSEIIWGLVKHSWILLWIYNVSSKEKESSCSSLAEFRFKVGLLGLANCWLSQGIILLLRQKFLLLDLGSGKLFLHPCFLFCSWHHILKVECILILLCFNLSLLLSSLSFKDHLVILASVQFMFQKLICKFCTKA